MRAQGEKGQKALMAGSAVSLEMAERRMVVGDHLRHPVWDAHTGEDMTRFTAPLFALILRRLRKARPEDPAG